jgi:hypothetical protein
MDALRSGVRNLEKLACKITFAVGTSHSSVFKQRIDFSILHPERIIGNPKVIGPSGCEIGARQSACCQR